MNFFNLIDEDITLVLDNLPVGIIRINSNGMCVYANKYIFQILDIYDTEKVYEKYMSAIHKDDLDNELSLCKDFLHNHIESNNTVRFFDNISKDYRWFSIKRTIIRSRDGSLSFMNTFQDVHINKQMELQLREETLKAEKAYNHKSIFLANMSHEIRTPLNGIIGMLTLLEDTNLSNDQQDYILMVKECSFNLMTIINDILDFSKLEVGKIHLDVKTMNLQECIESTNDIVMSKIYEKSLEYTYNIDPSIPVCIKSDCNRIKQVLLNLLSNAIKFTDKGTIILNISSITSHEYKIYKKTFSYNKNIENNANNENLENTDENIVVDPTFIDNQIYLRFDIIDTGCGIDNNDKEKLFKSFSQIDNRLTSKIYQGTGLGLAISKELIELMDGVIWLDQSELEKGSTFSFIISSTIAVEELIPIDNSNDNVLKDVNVLIVDDNIHNRLSLSGLVTKWGMKPHIFSNGEEALYFTKLNKFDIGLIDICMPKLDGPSFANKLREQTEFNNKTIPLIALSSLGDKVSCLSKQFTTHLIKPIKEQKLKQLCIDSLLNRKNKSFKKDKIIIPNEVNQTSLENYIYDNNLSELKNNVRILIAEDIYINQRVIVSFLNKMGFDNIKVVENGEYCLNEIYEKDYDILLLDIRMPVKNGEVVMKEMSEYYLNNPDKRKPYVVAVTAYGMKEDKDKYLNMNFDDYISKPVSNILLEKCMTKFIEKLLKE